MLRFCQEIIKSSFALRYVLSGLVTMGIGCGRAIPGVYADITQGLCFIHSATTCIQGDKYKQYYDYPQCEDWLDNLVTT